MVTRGKKQMPFELINFVAFIDGRIFVNLKDSKKTASSAQKLLRQCVAKWKVVRKKHAWVL